MGGIRVPSPSATPIFQSPPATPRNTSIIQSPRELGDLGGCDFSSERVGKGNFAILPKHPPDKSLKPLRCLGYRI
ncbi:hypothetical protein L8106_23461 [Lyngbya sp. PCC 8106]|nr:hypothetical protein L8106_23461 [Lyngbya sp. PCC 8106]